MRRAVHVGFCAVVIWTLPAGRGDAAAPPLTARPEPLQGAVVKGTVMTAIKDEEDEWRPIYAWLAPLGEGGKARKTGGCARAGGLPERWSVGHGGFWVCNGFSLFGPGSMAQSWEWLGRLDLGELLKGRPIDDPEDDDVKERANLFSPREPARLARALSAVDFDFELHYDNLPVGRYAVKQFVLTNGRGRVIPIGKSGHLGADYLEWTHEEKSTPFWSLTVHGYEGAWDRGAKRWKHGKWVKEGTIEVGFREPFRVLARGEDYYFLTDSGRLFRAPKPANKGKHRKIETVWDEWRSPITAFVTDADRQRTFLFCDKGRGGKGGPCVFELADGVRLRTYDPKLYKLGDKGPERLRRVVAYARVLEALGHVKQ